MRVLWVLSLVFWSLLLVVGLKYAVLMPRADNRGEGGIMALLALGILVALFIPQHRGTAFIGGLFSPIMSVWLFMLALLRAVSIARAPAILSALNPEFAARFLIESRWHSLLALGP